MNEAIAKIFSARPDTSKAEFRGTAFAVSGRLGLTAFHCVGDRNSRQILLSRIYLVFPRRLALEAEYLKGDADADFALVKFVEPLPTDFPCLRLVVDTFREERFHAPGYPATITATGPLDFFTVTGKVTEPFGSIQGVSAIQLYSRESAADLSLHGLSGAPVLISDPLGAVGIVRWNPPRSDDEAHAAGGTLFACPIRSVLALCPELDQYVLSRSLNGPPVISDILMPRIIGAPDGESATLTTVYLSSTGDETYIVDSIRIVHDPGPLFGMTSGAVGPDVEYQFSFSYGSDRTPALKPALRLSPEDRREVLLTLALSPEGVFRSSTGTVLAWLQYHTMDGRRGSLLLREPPQEGVLVAQLLGEPVNVELELGLHRDGWLRATMVVSPLGVQIGDDHRFRLTFRRLVFPSLGPSWPLGVPEDSRRLSGIEERLPINEAIKRKSLLPAIAYSISKGELTGFDLCAGFPDPECDTILLDVAKKTDNETVFINAITALALRHMIQTSPLLASVALHGISKFDAFRRGEGSDTSCLENAANLMTSALGINPVGEWSPALFHVAESGWRCAVKALVCLYQLLTPNDRDRLKTIVQNTEWEEERVLLERARKEVS